MISAIEIKLQNINTALSKAQTNYEVVRKNIADLITVKQTVNTCLDRFNKDLAEKQTSLHEREKEQVEFNTHLMDIRINLNLAQENYQNAIRSKETHIKLLKDLEDELVTIHKGTVDRQEIKFRIRLRSVIM